MGVKKRFIEMVQSGYPEFDPQNDTLEIEFEGGGDSFGSFSYISIWPNRDGSLNLEDHFDLLYEIIEMSGVNYNWNNAGTTGNIKYNEEGEQEITVYTIVSEEYWGGIEEEDDEELDDEMPSETDSAGFSISDREGNDINDNTNG
jgi:hypothetical protein